MCIPYDCCHHILWNTLIHVCTSWDQQISRAGESGFCVLWYYDPHVKPSHLQPKKPGCNRSPEEHKKQMCLVSTWLNRQGNRALSLISMGRCDKCSFHMEAFLDCKGYLQDYKNTNYPICKFVSLVLRSKSHIPVKYSTSEFHPDI